MRIKIASIRLKYDDELGRRALFSKRIDAWLESPALNLLDFDLETVKFDKFN